MNQPISRRSFLQRATVFTLAALSPIKSVLAQSANWAAVSWNAFFASSPIQTIDSTQLNSREFNGDDAIRGHEVFWDLAGYIKRKGGLPPPSEEADVVVIGGGAAGLSAAYALRDLKPIIIEQDKFFGGNSKGEKIGDSIYPIGAVYTGSPDSSGNMMWLLNELGLTQYARVEHSAETTVYYQNKFFRGFWDSATDPAARAQFKQVFDELRTWQTDQRKSMALAFRDGAISSETRRLDAMTFLDWLKWRFGQVHPHLLEYFQLYGWSSFLGSIDELSAAQMIGFVSSETGSIATFPGGLSAITQALHARLHTEVGAANLRPSSLVLDIRMVDGFVHITYEDAQRNLRTIRAKACVFAAPKFVAKYVCRDMPAAQVNAIKQITYRGYVVANVILDSPLASPSFELYCLKGEVPRSPTAHRPSDRPFTDICFSTWANHDRSGNGVISVYKGLAYDGARAHLYHPGAHDKHRAQILKGIEPLLQSLGKTPANVIGIRLTRWGHTLPLAYKGMIASGTLELAHQSIGDRIYFANQDNWANPCFETALAEALDAARTIRAKLGR